MKWTYHNFPKALSSRILFSFGASMMSVMAQGAEPQLAPSEARAIVKEWVQLEQLISEEQNEWQQQKSAMQDLIELYQTEVNLIEEELSAAGSSTQELDSKAEDLKKQTADFQRQRDELESVTLKQAKSFVSLSKSLPQPLQEQIKRELATIEDVESSLRERSVALLNALKSVAQFNGTINYADLEQEVGGTKRQLRVLYLGLGQAFYVSGDQAGIGKPVNGTWQWTEVANSRAQISKAIAIYQKTARPELISLPIQSK